MRSLTTIRILAFLILFLLAGVLLATCSLHSAVEVPALALAPSAGGPGSTIHVSGSGFPADTGVEVRLGPPLTGATPHAYATAVASAQGTFALRLILPATWPDGSPITRQELLVIALNQDGSIQTSAPLVYRPAPALTVAPASAKPGASLSVSGIGFAANQSLSLHLASSLNGPDPLPLATVVADDDGRFTAGVRVPERWSDSGASVVEQALTVEAWNRAGGRLVAAVPLFNSAGTIEASFYHPLPLAACREIQEAVATALVVEVDRTVSASFRDLQSGLTGQSCRLVAIIAGTRSEDYAELVEDVVRPLTGQGWLSDPEYLLEQTDGMVVGLRREEALAVVSILREPVPGTVCPEDVPRATCNSAPLSNRWRYRAVVELALRPEKR